MAPETVYLIGIIPVAAAVFTFGLRRVREDRSRIKHQRDDLRGWIVGAVVAGAVWPAAIVAACILAIAICAAWALTKGLNALAEVIIPDPDSTGPQAKAEDTERERSEATKRTD